MLHSNRMAYVNVAEWNPEHVADWLRGLEDEIQPYTQFFVDNKINGCKLLTLARDDLANLNMTKIGHQELVLEAVELLRQLHYNLTSETLQSLALKLGCKAQSLFNDLKRVCQDFADTGKKERVSAETLSSVSDIINLVKSLISWLDRYPFAGQESYSDVRKTILKHSIELASTAQRDQFADNPHKIIKETCLKLVAQSDKIVQEFNDSLIIQPASLEVAKVKRKTDDDLGIHINSLYSGIHIIENIKFQSPAYRSGKVEEGDEIVQVNYQTVIGWQIKNIICAMKEHPSEVHLTLKKRPRHPNVLGQVITLWPYRIPSKKTAFRKLYKFNKSKDIRDLCPKSPGTRGESNSVSEANEGVITDKEKLFASNKPRNRLRRRATVTGVSPTHLHAPVSFEELMDGNSKRKDTVLRTISYDPNKTVDLEDNVFKKEIQNCTQDDKSEAQSSANKGRTESIKQNDAKDKSTYLCPPQEKFNTSHLKRQEALKDSETVSKSPVSKTPPAPIVPNCAPPKPPLRTQQNTTNDPSSAVQEVTPVGSQSPKQKFAEWVSRQKKKTEDSSTQQCSSPVSKECGSPKSPKFSIGSPKTRKSSGNMFQFPFREGRPSLSELRGLKKAATSKAFSERVCSVQCDKPLTSPKHNSLYKRSQVQCKKQALGSKPTKESKPVPRLEDGTWKKSVEVAESYIHPKSINYAKIPQYPYEMHESKIISLKGNRNSNYTQNGSKVNTAPSFRNNVLHYQRARQMGKTTQGTSTLLRNHKSGYPTAFYSPSGRSLSFNNIAMSSDDSSSEEYEIYEELDDEDEEPPPPPPQHHHQQNFMQQLQHDQQQNLMHNGQIFKTEIDPAFRKQVAEVYDMLSQRQNFVQSQINKGYRGPMNPPNPAIIDELALRMYHALRMNHMQSQNTLQTANQRPSNRIIPNTVPSYIPYQNGVSNTLNKHCQGNSYQPIYPVQNNQRFPCNGETLTSGKNPVNSFREHLVNLPRSAYHPQRAVNPMFKSATSQEIHNLYTSQTATKNNVNVPFENDKHTGCQSEQYEKNHTYESIPCQNLKSKYLDEKDTCIHSEKCEEKVFLYPAEKEFEQNLSSKDSQTSDKRIIDTKTGISPNSLKGMKDNMFCPIKENCSFDTKPFDGNISAFKPFVPKQNHSTEINGNVSNLNFSEVTDNHVNDIVNMYDKHVQPAINSLINNIPKPPAETYFAQTKSSSSQTDSDLCKSDSNDQFNEEYQVNSNICLDNDESFTSALNCTNDSVNESPSFSSSSSLNSSSSGSTISSSGSCYYYVETQIKPQFTIKFPSVTSENGEETSLIDLRSPTLPTMGVSMLSKKRNTSSCSSEQSSNAGSRASPNVPSVNETDGIKPSRIVTDVEQTI